VWPVGVAIGGDCEAVRGGLLSEPANALSSVAFVMAAVWIAVRAPSERPARDEVLWFAAALGSNGLASFAFHGASGPWMRWPHDVAARAIPILVVSHDVGLVRGRSVAWRLRLAGAGVLTVGAMLAIWPDLLVTLGFAAAFGVGLAELAAARAGHRPGRGADPGGRADQALVLGVLAVAGVAFLLGRTGSPWCRPASLAQPHAVWHVAVAVVVALYVRSAPEFGVIRRRRGHRGTAG
jgi:hypothetical protein